MKQWIRNKKKLRNIKIFYKKKRKNYKIIM